MNRPDSPLRVFAKTETDRVRHNRIVAVVVNWNTRELTRQCLGYLRHLQAMVRIVVVDNGSTDGSIECIRAEYPWVDLIENGSNLGFARACNVGWRQTTEEYVLLLNSDTIPGPEAIEALASYLDANLDVGVVGPYLRLGDGKPQVGAAGWDLKVSSALSYNLGLHRLLPRRFKPFYVHQPHFRLKGPVPVDWVSGAAMMVRRELLVATNGVPEDFFMYAEDIDLCVKAKALGWRVIYLPDVEIIHLQGGSGKVGKVNTRWLVSTLSYYRNKKGLLAGITLSTIFAFGAVLRALLVLPHCLVSFRQPAPKLKLKRLLAYARASFASVIHPTT